VIDPSQPRSNADWFADGSSSGTRLSGMTDAKIGKAHVRRTPRIPVRENKAWGGDL
jgi:hypothetical protein